MNALNKLSNEEVESSLKRYVLQERQVLHVVLEHIKEVENRQIYLQRAYSSMYEYLVREHGYSGSAAMRRLEAARLLRVLPEMAEKIKDGSVNLSKIGEMSKAIKEKERTTSEKVSVTTKSQLMHMISNKTMSEAQQTLAQVLDIKLKEHEVQRVQKDESVRAELTLSKELSEKLSKCKDLAAHLLRQKHMDTSLASVIEILADQFLERRTFVQKTRKMLPETSVADARTTAAVLPRVNKTLTPKIRLAVFNRDGGCQFRDNHSGKICGSRFAPQTDHKTSRWAGGTHELQNLQIYCAAHNGFKYKLESFVHTVG